MRQQLWAANCCPGCRHTSHGGLWTMQVHSRVNGLTSPRRAGAGTAWRHSTGKSIKVCSVGAQVSWTLDRRGDTGITHRRPDMLQEVWLTEVYLRITPPLWDQDTGMYPSSQSARHPAQALSMSSQYIPPPYDFYHHHGDPSPTSAWSSIYAPREEYAYSYPGSSPSAGQVSSFTPVELSGTPTAAGGGSFAPYNFISGQDPFNCRGRPQEPLRPSAPGGTVRSHTLSTEVNVACNLESIIFTLLHIRSCSCSVFVTMTRLQVYEQSYMELKCVIPFSVETYVL